MAPPAQYVEAWDLAIERELAQDTAGGAAAGGCYRYLLISNECRSERYSPMS